ncbi:MAG: cytochrome c [Flavobacterium sp.]|jgi:cytochrome c
MKTYVKPFFALTIALVFASCGDKKPKEDFGKSAEEVTTETAVEEIDANPLLAEGKILFEGKGTCVACHKPDVKIIGPSIADISKIYKEQNASIVSFLKEEGKPIVDPSQYEVMKANFVITKAMSDDELKALEAYVLSY